MAQVWRRPASGLALAYAVGPVGPGGHVNVPDGRCGLVWADSAVWWLGPATRPWIPDRALDTVIGIRFSYVTGHGFAGTALGPWRDMRVELSELQSHRAQAAELNLTLAACTSPARQVAALLGYASAHATSADNAAVQMLEAARRGDSVSAVAARLALSTRQVHRRSQDVFGMPLSTLRRIIRLHRTSAARGTGATATLASLAAESGFSDQAHLARECRALTLAPPSRALIPGGVAVSDSFKLAPRPTF